MVKEPTALLRVIFVGRLPLSLAKSRCRLFLAAETEPFAWTKKLDEEVTRVLPRAS